MSSSTSRRVPKMRSAAPVSGHLTAPLHPKSVQLVLNMSGSGHGVDAGCESTKGSFLHVCTQSRVGRTALARARRGRNPARALASGHQNAVASQVVVTSNRGVDRTAADRLSRVAAPPQIAPAEEPSAVEGTQSPVFAGFAEATASATHNATHIAPLADRREHVASERTEAQPAAGRQALLTMARVETLAAGRSSSGRAIGGGGGPETGDRARAGVPCSTKPSYLTVYVHRRDRYSEFFAPEIALKVTP